MSYKNWLLVTVALPPSEELEAMIFRDGGEYAIWLMQQLGQSAVDAVLLFAEWLLKNPEGTYQLFLDRIVLSHPVLARDGKVLLN